MRLMPASSAAWLKLVNERVTPSRVCDVVVNAVLSPKVAARMAAAAFENVECPETYSGCGGVLSSGFQFGSAVSD